MNSENRRHVILGVAAVAAIGAAAFFAFGRGDDNEIPKVSGGIYYTGPMKSKTAGSNSYGTIGGEKLSEDQAKAQIDQWVQQHSGELNQSKGN